MKNIYVNVMDTFYDLEVGDQLAVQRLGTALKYPGGAVMSLCRTWKKTHLLKQIVHKSIGSSSQADDERLYSACMKQFIRIANPLFCRSSIPRRIFHTSSFHLYSPNVGDTSISLSV